MPEPAAAHSHAPVQSEAVAGAEPTAEEVSPDGDEAAQDTASPADPSPATPSMGGVDEVSADTGHSDSDAVGEGDADPVVGARAGETAAAGD